MKILLILFLLTSTLRLLAQNRLEFISENIGFSIDDSLFEVNGIYVFYNPSEMVVKRAILFPLAENAKFPEIKRVCNLTYQENIDFEFKNNKIYFSLLILPHDTISLNIKYSQKTDSLNIYILESTNAWNHSLQKARYSLTFDHAVEIDSLSITPDSISSNIYFWSKTDYYPEEDFKIWIRQGN